MNRAAIVLLFLAVACARAAESPFDAAESAVANLKLARARELFREAQQKDAGPERRDKAAIAMAKIDWRAFHNYQVRPMYADGPVLLWLRTADPELRAKEDADTAEETKRDVARAAAAPIGHFPGLRMRLERQYAGGLVAALRAKGLSGDALRDAFIARARSDTFESSIWAHEGRHAIDQKEGIKESAELEFRAKVSEVALAPAPRSALVGGIITGGIGAATSHRQANKRVAEGAVAWMRAHAGEIAGLDAAAPLLPQLDKLTDEQLRAAFRSMDPFAVPPR